MRLLPAFCLVVVFSTTIHAQSVFGLGEEVRIPTLGSYTPSGPGVADHATVAINDRGDVCVAWHVRAVGSNQRQVEAAVIPRGQLYRWSFPSQLHTFSLGDPSLAILDLQEECQKPDIVAIGSSFMICWPRIDLVNNRARLEGALIVQDSATGIWSVNQPQTGEGWVLDEPNPANSHLLTPGHAGVMPDLVARSTRAETAAVVYAHETGSSGQGSSLELEYDLRCLDVDWSTTPPTLGPVMVFAQTFVDGAAVGINMGGRVLPDVIEDDFGNLICAFEEFIIIGHGGAQSETSAVRVIRFREDFGNLLLLDDIDFTTSPNSGLRMRRPNLATSRIDPSNTASLAWMEFPMIGGNDDISYYELDFQSQHAGGNIVATNYNFPNLSSRNDDLPVVLHDAGFRGLIFSSYLPQASRTAIGLFGNSKPIPSELGTASIGPWRPATDLRPLPNSQPGSPWSRLIAVTWEAQENSSAPTQIYLRIFKI